VYGIRCMPQKYQIKCRDFLEEEGVNFGY